MLNDQAIDLLPEDGSLWMCPTLLDVNALDHFIKWLDKNPDFAARLKDGRWRIAVLEHHVERHPNWENIKKKLNRKKIDLIVHVFQKSDDAFLREIRRAYFGNDPDSDQSVELLAYGRINTDSGAAVRVISRHRSFRLVPNVQRYHLNIPEIGLDNEEAYLRAVMILDFNKHVRRAATDLIMGHNHTLALQQAAIAFAEEVRSIGILHELPFKDVKNDQPMVDQALQCTEGEKNRPEKEKLPHIKLNHLKLPSEWSEQKGYHNIMCGVISAVRNPTVHTRADEDFLQSRFGDRRTALKFLCLLSLLFEKLENRTAPW